MLNWNDIRGQDRPKEVLQRALESRRMHHAYLFVGPEGVGKYATAEALTAVLNCERREEGVFQDFCGECPACRKIRQHQHPDVHFVLPEGGVNKTIKIETVRELQKAAVMRPYEAKWRVVVIDDAHLMTAPAANALLKTLEEPPDTMRLILVTDQPNRLLVTILSRCQRLRFGALAEEDVVELLGEVLTDADEDVPDEETLRVAAKFGEGSVGRAHSVLVSGLLPERRELVEKIAALEPGQPIALLDLAGELSSDRNELAERLDLIKVLLRDVMILRATGRHDRVVNHDLVDVVEELARKTTIEKVMSDIEHVRTAQERLAGYVHARIVTENLLDEIQPRRRQGRQP